MDDDKGNFKPLSEKEFIEQSVRNKDKLFKVGEVLKIKQSEFRILRIGKKEMTLKLLPKLKEEKK
jgi:uncharacterized Zn finger protein